jgi:ubiquinone/menaquinone biosynthesis C-methylase UbiE
VPDPQSFDSFAERYDAVAALERSHDFILNHLPDRRGTVLEVGCGTGLLAGELARHFTTVVAVDVSEPMLAIAKRKHAAPNIEYRLADANNLRLNQSFNAIVSHTTFHHLQNIDKTLAVLKAGLAAGGRMIIVDRVSRLHDLARHSSVPYWVLALLRNVPDIGRYGPIGARQLLDFRISREWIAHVRSDRYLTASQFREVYGRLLPGAQFTRLTHCMGVVWTTPGS